LKSNDGNLNLIIINIRSYSTRKFLYFYVLPLATLTTITRTRVILQGGGDHARVVLDCLLDQGISVAGIFDPQQSGHLFGIPQLGNYQKDYEPEASCVVAIGDNAVRKKVADHTVHKFINVIHASAIVSSRSKIGNGNMILHHSIIQACAVIGDHVIINTGAQVDHDCKVDSYAHIAPGAVLCGSVNVGEGAFVGAGAVVIPGKKIGRWAVIGAGSVIRTDVPDYTVVAGNPARMIRHLKS
jgi:sugar O-acyltransferase (sialic acid O-acetyltransferase NeuD family)